MFVVHAMSSPTQPVPVPFSRVAQELRTAAPGAAECSYCCAEVGHVGVAWVTPWLIARDAGVRVYCDECAAYVEAVNT